MRGYYCKGEIVMAKSILDEIRDEQDIDAEVYQLNLVFSRMYADNSHFVYELLQNVIRSSKIR